MEENLKLITPSELHSLLFTLSLSLSRHLSSFLFSMAQATKPYIFPPSHFYGESVPCNRRAGGAQPERFNVNLTLNISTASCMYVY